MNQKQKLIISAIVIAIVLAAFLWSANNNNSRGKYKAPYKYYQGDRSNFGK